MMEMEDARTSERTASMSGTDHEQASSSSFVGTSSESDEERRARMIDVMVSCLNRWPPVRPGIQPSDLSLHALERVLRAGIPMPWYHATVTGYPFQTLIELLKEQPSDNRPRIVVHVDSLGVLQQTHSLLARLRPHCKELWLVMDKHQCDDAFLACVMLCSEMCDHSDVVPAGMLALTGIVLTLCQALTDTAMAMLAQVDRVKIDHCDQLTSSGFAHLGHCTDVSARGTALRDADLIWFAKAKTLDLGATEITPCGLEQLADVTAVRTHFFSKQLGKYPNAASCAL